MIDVCQTTKRIFLCSFAFALFSLQSISAQQPNWIDLKEQGANYYDVKKAFLKKNAGKMNEFRRELRKESKKSKTRKSDESEKDVEEILQFMRWSQFVEPRVLSLSGDLSAMRSAAQQAYENRAQKLKERRAISSSTGNWTPVGPKTTPLYGGNGRLNAVRPHPTNSSILFACSPAGGLWKSMNGGNSWAPVTDQLSTLGCTDVAFDPTNPNTMYLATGDRDHNDAPSTGVYKSTDGGASWAVTGLSFAFSSNISLAAILVNPSNPNILITGGNGGIFRSVNGGANWTQTSPANIKDIHFKSNDPNTLFASGKSFYKSTDGGASWQDVTGPSGLPTNARRMSIGVTPADGAYVYVLAANNTNYGFQGLYRSVDGGATFTSVSSSPNILGYNYDGGDAGGQGWYTLSIAVSPTDRNAIYTGGVNIWKSADGGKSWKIQTHWYGDQGLPYVHADVHDIRISGTDIYVSCDGGAFKSSVLGGAWNDLSSNLSIAQIYGIGLSATNTNLIISGHQDNGTNLTTDKNSWAEVIGGDGMQCFIDATNDNVQYGELYYGDFQKSTNGGTTFNSIGAGFKNGAWVTPWLQDPTSPSTIYAGGYDVYKSANGGANFSSISSFGKSASLVALDVTGTSSQIIYAAFSNKLYKTINGGSSWTDVTSGLPSGISITGVKIDPNNPNSALVSFAGYGSQQVYSTKDAGVTWTNFSAGLPAIPALCFAFDKTSTQSGVYAGTDLGVYYRDNTLNSWAYFSNGIPGVPIFDLKIFYGGANKIRAATFGRGIYESDLYISSAVLSPQVAITAPIDNATFIAPASVAITANASEPNGSIAKVEFYSGATLLATVTIAPYTYNWTNVAAGIYTLTAKAYDPSNKFAISSPVHITVNTPVVLTPQVSISSPADNAIFTSLATVAITANASEPNGSIAKVEFYNGATLLGTVVNAPYIYNWTNVAAGNYTLSTKAYDASNKSVVSAFIHIVVNNPVKTLDAGISYIASPSGMVNSASSTPLISLQNFGTIPITLVTIYYKIDGAVESAYHWSGNLGVGSTTNVSLPTVSYIYGAHIFAARTSVPNGGADANTANDGAVSNFNYPVPVVNDAGISSVTVPSGNIQNSTMAPIVTLKNYGNSTLQSVVIKGMLDNSAASSNTLKWMGTLAPGAVLSVTLAPISYSPGAHVFSAATSLPNGAADANSQNDGASSNFIFTPPQPDAGISAVVTPGAVVQIFTFTPVVALKNFGVLDIKSVDIFYRIDNGSEFVFHWTGLLSSGATTTVSLTGGFVFITAGRHTFSARTSLPNGVADGVPANDAVTVNFTYSGFGFDAKPIAENANVYDRLDFSISPNPANDMVYLKIKAPVTGVYTLTALNVLGKEMQKKEIQLTAGDNLAPVDLRGYSTGLYFIQLNNGGQRSTKKVTIK